MTAEEMKQEFDMLYKMMASSNNVNFMHIFGQVMADMMNYLIQVKPDVADDMIQKLESIKWANYLSPKEAQRIIDGMIPKAPWNKDVWGKTMAQLGLQTVEEPYYNPYALWVEMNKQYSDHAETIARDILKKPLSDVPTEQVVNGMYSMALDVLKDRDKVYSIRKYFSL